MDKEKLEQVCVDLLNAIGEDVTRDGLRETPARWAKWWAEFINFDPGKCATAFEVSNADSLVAVTGIRVWSLCEHHLLPFNADISIGYIPRDRVLGLSKFARISLKASHRLQVQERLTNDIADLITEYTGSPDVGVIAAGEHLCMTMRGVRSSASMRTSVMRGSFREDEKVRAEFLELIRE